jgi:hypothetical protein
MWPNIPNQLGRGLPAVRDISLSDPQRIYKRNCFYFHAILLFSA